MKPIWYLLFPSCVVATALYVAYRNYAWWHSCDSFGEADKWIGLVLGTLLTVILCLPAIGIAALFSHLIGNRSDQLWVQCWHGKLVSLRSADGIEGKIAGSLFLMSGFVESRQTYFYYTLNKDGSFKPGRWVANSDSSVHEEERKDGEVVQFEGRFKRPWVEWFGETDGRIRMDFHIPKGSLHQAFDLN